MNTTDCVLQVENVSKVYGIGVEKTRVLKKVSFCVRRGEFVAVVGASGSGKSTLLHILAGVDPPTTGRVLVDGVDLYARDDKALSQFRCDKIGIVYQFFNLIPMLNVEENILLPVLLAGREIDRERLNTILKMLDMLPKIYAMPGQLSGGQQQRAAIGRALINEPAILLADEPTGSLDSVNGQQIIDHLVKSNREKQQTLILITHDMQLAALADRVFEISDGQILRDTAQNEAAP